MLRKEPEASIIQETLEDFANWVLNTHEEVAEFLQKKGLVISRRVKNRKKNWPEKIHRSLVGRILRNILYAGYIEYKEVTRDKKTGLVKKTWDISLRKAKHEWLIPIEAYWKIQERLRKKTPYKV
jgi:transcription initiation factor IIE alpha subunit